MEQGFFWGTTAAGGGSPGFGTIFKVNAVTGVRTTVVRFTGTDSPKGRYPQTALVSDGAGYLWGTTFSSAPYTRGTIFKVHTGTGLLTTVAELSDSAGGAVGARDLERTRE